MRPTALRREFETVYLDFGFQTPSKEWISEPAARSATEVRELDLYRDRNYKLSIATRRDVKEVCYYLNKVYDGII